MDRLEFVLRQRISADADVALFRLVDEVLVEHRVKERDVDTEAEDILDVMKVATLILLFSFQ